MDISGPTDVKDQLTRRLEKYDHISQNLTTGGLRPKLDRPTLEELHSEINSVRADAFSFKKFMVDELKAIAVMGLSLLGECMFGSSTGAAVASTLSGTLQGKPENSKLAIA